MNATTGAAPACARPKLSVCIITGNEEENIRRCLESVSFADEIVVVDSFSTDRTLEIVREFTDRVFQHRWLGYIGQKSIARGLARGEWILFVDADEAVSPGLRAEIEALFRDGVPDEVAGFDFPRMVWFLHRWIRHGDWYPDAKLRLFRKERGRCCGTEPHERIDVSGEVRHLKSPLYHYTYDDIEDQLRTMNRFSSISARNDRLQRRSPFALFACMLLHPPFRFLRCWVFKRGFLDGMAGLVIARTVAYGTFIKYAKAWERRVETGRAAKVAKGGAAAVTAALLLCAAGAVCGARAES
ncbi:MAG: glycosyltransferase family 2 protein, partial [Kiritimatiellae bacterium]|nr:glycosyltransferase family 2 protein [Kiritimatiellia bacterium]